MNIELLVLADDLTGALDTGAQFAARGAKAHVLVSWEASGYDIPPDATVLIVNTDSRHIPEAEAYARVYRIALQYADAGVTRFYKKTDSVLRGNVSEELRALMDAADAQALPFVPAYPLNGRVTRGGIQYVDGLPIEDSSFAKDPLYPVRESDVIKIMKKSFPDETALIGRPYFLPPDTRGALVFDAETEEDLLSISSALEANGLLNVTAGCAGFAAHLPIRFSPGGSRGESVTPPYFFLSGSLNRVTLRQLAEAGKAGARIFRLTPEQLLGLEPLDRTASLIGEALSSGFNAVLTSALVEQDGSACLALARLHGLKPDQARARQQHALARLFLRIHTQRRRYVIGGDTLLAMIRQMGAQSITPLREIAPGVVLNRIDSEYIITKSGGFGDPELLARHCRGEA